MTTETVTIAKGELALLLSAAEILAALTTDEEVDDRLADMMLEDGLLTSRAPTDAEIEAGDHVAGDGGEFDSFVDHTPEFMSALAAARTLLGREVDIEADVAVYQQHLPQAGSFSD